MQRKTEVWIIAGFAILIVLATIAAAFFSGSVSTPGSFQATQTSAVEASDHTRGAAQAKVSLMEYGDFQCPACGQYEPLVEQLMQQYGDRVQLVFRNFPLVQIHQNAMISAQAAEAAALQGKYWEMHDLLYEKQTEWSNVAPDKVVSQYFQGYAQSLGLNVQKFLTDIESAQVKQKIDKDIAAANAAQVDHTPTFFINLTQIPNPANYAQFTAAIDAALASTTASQ